VDALQDVGAARSIVIDEDNVILAGNGVATAAAQAGMTAVRVIDADGDELIAVRRSNLTAEQKRKLAIYDNRTAELAEWNVEQLRLDHDAGLDLTPYFDTKELRTLFAGAVKPGRTDPDAVPETRATDIQHGDLLELGAHRLLCGDCTVAADVARVMGEDKPVVLTDPPYGIDIVKGKKVGGGSALKFGKVGGGGWVDSTPYAAVTNDDSTDTARAFYTTARECQLDRMIIWGGNYFTAFLPPSACWLIWDKENTGNFADAELAWTSFAKAVRMYRWMWNGLARKGARSVEGVSRVHPTQKPVGLHVEIIQNWTDAADAVLDGFSGSGTTLIACEQVARRCRAIEIEPQYVQVALDRWEAFTGQRAVKVGEAVHAGT